VNLGLSTSTGKLSSLFTSSVFRSTALTISCVTLPLRCSVRYFNCNIYNLITRCYCDSASVCHNTCVSSQHSIVFSYELLFRLCVRSVAYLGFCKGRGERRRREVRGAGGAGGVSGVNGVSLSHREGSGQGAVPLPIF